MTKMSYGGSSSYNENEGVYKEPNYVANPLALFGNYNGGASQPPAPAQPMGSSGGAVFGGSTPGIISGAMGGSQEYNPVTPLPRIYSDTPDQTSSQAQAYGGYVANPLAIFGNYNGTDNTMSSSPGVKQLDTPYTQTGGGKAPVFGGSTSGATADGYPPKTLGLIANAVNGLQSWQVDPSQTVEGRSAGIINKDSPLMQQAAGYASQRSNERGLINSSLGIQAAQDAVIGRATDIAKQDAATFADAGKFNVNQANSWNIAQQELAQKGSQFDKDLQYRYDSARMNNENAIAMREIENKYQSQLQSDAAFNSQYRAYVDALLIIDQDKELGPKAKLERKIEQAQILENYARVRGLNLDLNFSAEYKAKLGAAGSGTGSANAPGGGAAGPAGGESGPTGESGGGDAGGGPGGNGAPSGPNGMGANDPDNGLALSDAPQNGPSGRSGVSSTNASLASTVAGLALGPLASLATNFGIKAYNYFADPPAAMSMAAAEESMQGFPGMQAQSAEEAQAAVEAANAEDAAAAEASADDGSMGGGFGDFGDAASGDGR